MQILIEKLLQWDCSKKSKGKGVLGHVTAFVIAHEEQGRYMLHSHMQLFLEELSVALRKLLFAKDADTKTQRREGFLDHADEVIDPSYSVKLVTDCPKEGCKDDFVSQEKVQNAPDIDKRIAKARHNASHCDLNAQLMQCPVCLETC